MNTIELNGVDADDVATAIGGTLILLDVTNDTALIAGGDLSKLDESCNVRK